MKIVILLASLVPVFACAAAPSDETADVAEVLLRTPGVAESLRQYRTFSLNSVEVEQGEPGVREWKLAFGRRCECIQGTSTVRVHEDRRPENHDGSPIYKGTVEFQEQQ